MIKSVATAEPCVAAVACGGLLALAVAMGIGRFAFTPIMPIMQADNGLSLTAASWLAAANYLGYLLGALGAARLSLTQAVRGGLLLVATTTLLMGVTHALAMQLLWRLLAGAASAWVLIHVSAWSLARLQALGQPKASGVVYAGVGVGIAAAGLLVLGTMQLPLDADRTWQLFGVLALLAALALWRVFSGHDVVAHPARDGRRPRWSVDQWRLLGCYGALGIGYIIPATYLPAMAHRYISDPLVFGLAWPVFGAAAALSTWIAARWLAHVNDRRLWALCYLAMAVGVALPACWPRLAAILLAALLVGGTFMVVTMAGLREARRVGGAGATAFIAALTAAFAVGQIAGPLLVAAVARWDYGMTLALLLAAAVLLVSAVSLWRSSAPGD